MSPDRRVEDRLVVELMDMVREQNLRVQECQQRDNERFDRLCESMDQVAACSKEALTLAQENQKQLQGLQARLEEPLTMFETGKSGVVVIKTSGTIIKWIAGVMAAGALIWSIVTKKFGG